MSPHLGFPNAGSRFKDAHGKPVFAEPYFGRGQVVLVTDSSFLKAFDNGHLWAQHEWQRAKYDARTLGKNFEFLVPHNIINEYEASLNGKRQDRRGLRFANETLEDLLGMITLPPFSPKSLEDARVLALEAWRESYASALVAENPGVKIGKIRRRMRKGPGAPDLSVLASAITLAKQGAIVKVASSDFRDVIKPISFIKGVPNITPRPPSPVELKYFQGSGKRLEAVLTEEVVSDLQLAVESESSFPAVVFESKVKSGDAVFDAGVGVLQQQYGRPVQLPANYKCLVGESVVENRLVGSKHTIVPVVWVQRIDKSASAVARLAEAFKRHPGQQLLVVQYEDPNHPLLIQPSNPSSPAWYRPFRAGMDFLRYQTGSLFARENFVPDSKQPKSTLVQPF